MSGKFRWEGDLVGNLATMDARIKRGMYAAAKYSAGQAESYMKSEAKWTDRTSAARNGLGSQVVVESDKVAIVLYHSVPYGVFLEVRWGGKYAIIEPTIVATIPLFLEAVKRLAFSEV